MIIWLAIFILGAIIGSFLNVVILRQPMAPEPKAKAAQLPNKLTGRSICPNCHTKLSARELIPIVSFFLQRRRCRTCAKPISWQYPIIEAAMGLVAVIAFTPTPMTLFTVTISLLNTVVAGLLIILLVIDLKTMYLPDLFILLTTAPIVVLLFLQPGSLPDSLLGISIGAGFLAFLWLITRGRGIGLGDIKLMVPLGALLGAASSAVTLLIAFIAGGIFGSFLLLRKKANLKTAVPFGPFLISAALLLILFPTLGARLLGLFWPIY